MIHPRDIWATLRHPRDTLTEQLASPAAAKVLLVGVVTPLASIRAVALLVRSSVGGTPLAGVVLALGNLVLLVGVWLGVALVLPALAKQFRVEMSDRQGFVLATYASVPLWLAGVLWFIPDEPWMLLLWSRAIALVIAIYGLYILRGGLVAMELERSTRTPLLIAAGVACLTIYVVLSIPLGVAATVVMFVLSPG